MRFMWLLLGLTAASALNAEAFDTPEDAVQALEQAYIQKDLDAVIARLDFLEGGRQMLQETNPLMADDRDTVKHTAQILEQSFRDELRTQGFPDYKNLKCAFVGKTQIAPGLIKLNERCASEDGGKPVRDFIVMRRAVGWRVVAVSSVF